MTADQDTPPVPDRCGGEVGQPAHGLDLLRDQRVVGDVHLVVLHTGSRSVPITAVETDHDIEFRLISGNDRNCSYCSRENIFSDRQDTSATLEQTRQNVAEVEPAPTKRAANKITNHYKTSLHGFRGLTEVIHFPAVVPA